MSKPGHKKNYVSKHLHSNVSKNILNAMRRAKTNGEKMIDKTEAYWNGKNPWITINNPNDLETNKKFIRVRANDIYGSPKDRLKSAYVMKS